MPPSEDSAATVDPVPRASDDAPPGLGDLVMDAIAVMDVVPPSDEEPDGDGEAHREMEAMRKPKAAAATAEAAAGEEDEEAPSVKGAKRRSPPKKKQPAGSLLKKRSAATKPKERDIPAPGAASEGRSGDEGEGEAAAPVVKPVKRAAQKRSPPRMKTPPKGKAATTKGPAAAMTVDSSDEESDVEAGAVSPTLKERTVQKQARAGAPGRAEAKGKGKAKAPEKGQNPAVKKVTKKRLHDAGDENVSPPKMSKSGAMQKRPAEGAALAAAKSRAKAKAVKERPAKAAAGKAGKVSKGRKKKACGEGGDGSDAEDAASMDIVDDDDLPSDGEDEDGGLSQESGAGQAARSKAMAGLGVAFSSSDDVSAGLVTMACAQLNGCAIREAASADVFVRTPGSKRTGSLLLAIARGIPVVDVEWVSNALEAGKFERDLSKYETHEGAKAARIARESSNRAGFLRRARVKIVGEPMSDAALLRQIVQQCGGKIVQDKEHFTIVDGKLRDGGKSVNPVRLAYLADSIEKQTLLPEEGYQLHALAAAQR